MRTLPVITRGDPTNWPTRHTYPENKGEPGEVALESRYTVSGNPYISANRETMKPMYVPWAFHDPFTRRGTRARKSPTSTMLRTATLHRLNSRDVPSITGNEPYAYA